MKAQITFALFMILLGIMVVQNGAANCADEYVAEYHSLYIADIGHTPPSPEYAEYSLYGESGGDYDLFVLDSWNDTWYSSKTVGRNEYLKVPIHSGYDHTAYVWTYNGSGSWTLCSPQVTFREGFRRIADSDTAPDAAAVAAATGSSSGSASSGVAGRWVLTYDWDCDGSPDETELRFNQDGTFSGEDGISKGEWSRDGQSVRWEHNEDPNALYRGSLSGLFMSGTMSTTEGRTGCWSAKKAGE